MPHTTREMGNLDQEPLLSNRILVRIGVGLSLMAALTAAIVAGGEWLGSRIRLGGHTESREIYSIEIGQDRLALPANMIRFETERRSGVAERIDLYLLWPEMDGFSQAKADRFNDLQEGKGLVFVQISQAVMSHDMSGRVQPIYSHLFDGNPTDAGNGLMLHHFHAAAGYERDVLLTAPRANNAPDYAVRCVLPQAGEPSTSADCQRDFAAGRDLSVLYRFSSDLLPQWQSLDAAVARFIDQHLVRKAGETS